MVGVINDVADSVKELTNDDAMDAGDRNQVSQFEFKDSAISNKIADDVGINAAELFDKPVEIWMVYK